MANALVNNPHRMPEIDRTSAACPPSDKSEFFQDRAESAPNQLCTIELQVSCCRTGVEYVHHNVAPLSPENNSSECVPSSVVGDSDMIDDDDDDDDVEIDPPSDMESTSPYSFEPPDNLIFN